MIKKLKVIACIILHYATFKKVCFGDCKYCKL